MDWFNLCFPLFMILSPAVFSLFIKKVPANDADKGAQESKIDRLRTRLWFWTTIAVIVFAACYLWLPRELTRQMWVLFFPLWFVCVMPLLQAKDRGWGPIHVPEGTRSASLAPRDRVSPVPGWTWGLALAVWLVGIAILVWLLARQSAQGQGWWVGFFAFFGGPFWLAGGYLGVRMFLVEAEPIDPGASQELADAYEEFRRFKAWMVYGLSCAAMLLFLSVSLLLALGPQYEMIAIWIGAGGGSLLGILGGVFGTYGSIRRARLARLLMDLREEAQR